MALSTIDLLSTVITALLSSYPGRFNRLGKSTMPAALG